jgi:hypothetical protein
MIRYAEDMALPRLEIRHDVPESTLRWSQNKSHISNNNPSPLRGEGKGEGEIIFNIAGAT